MADFKEKLIAEAQNLFDIEKNKKKGKKQAVVEEFDPKKVNFK